MTGQLCPECGTPRDTYGRSGAGCHCTERAETAAAEDFDPLRIRPYVRLEDPDGAVPSIPPPPPPHGGDRSEGTDPAETMQLSLPGLRTTAPRAAADGPERAGGRRTFAMVALAAAAVAVIGTVSFAGGLFTGGGDDDATSDLNSGLPTASVRPDDPSASESASASASKQASASASASAGASASASSSASTPGAGGPASPSVQPAAPGEPSTEAPRPDGPGTTQEADTEAGAAAGLRRGDSGARVEELQRRLSEVWLYRDAYDGQFGERVEAAVRIYQSYKSIEGDPSGVYGENTRRALEAETSGKGREQGGGGRPGDGPGRDEDWRD